MIDGSDVGSYQPCAALGRLGDKTRPLQDCDVLLYGRKAHCVAGSKVRHRVLARDGSSNNVTPRCVCKGMEQQIHLLELIAEDTDHRLPEHGGRDRHVALEVSQLDEVMLALDRAAVDYTLSRSGRRALFCRDPDGNAIELIEA